MIRSKFFIFLIIIACCACNDTTKTPNTLLDYTHNSTQRLTGVWERTGYYNYDENGKISDSFTAMAGNRHIKIFTQDKVMWCRNISLDSTEWFGYGHYTITDSLLVEELEYGSVKISKRITRNPKFTSQYTITENKFSQIQIDEQGHALFAENYIRLE